MKATLMNARGNLITLVEMLRSNGINVSDACFGESGEPGHQVMTGVLLRRNRGYMWADIIENDQLVAGSA